MRDIKITRLPAEKAATLVPLVEQVHDLHAKALPDVYPANPDPEAVALFLRGWLSGDNITALVAGSADAPSGYLIYGLEHRPGSVLRNPASVAMLHHICVADGQRGQGVGTALITAMRARAAQENVTGLMTSYGAFNIASARLMARNGFEPRTILAAAPL